MRAAFSDPATLAKMREATKARWGDPSMREKMIAGMRVAGERRRRNKDTAEPGQPAGLHTPDLTDEEQTAVGAALRKLIDEDKFPFSEQLRPLKSALAKLTPPRPKAPPPSPIAGASEAAIRRRKRVKR